MDHEQVYRVLKQHFAAFAKQADTPSVEVPKPIRDTLAMVETKYGEKSFVPHNFDEVMALVSHTQRKGFEKLQPMFEWLQSCETFEDLLSSPGVRVEIVHHPALQEGIISIAKKMDESGTNVILYLYPQNDDADPSDLLLAKCAAYVRVPGGNNWQQEDWIYELILGEDKSLRSELVMKNGQAQIQYCVSAEVEVWACWPQITNPPGTPGYVPLQFQSKRTKDFVELSLFQPAGDQTSRFCLLSEVAVPRAKFTLEALDVSPFKTSNSEREIAVGRHYIFKNGPHAKYIDMADDWVYEGEYVDHPDTGFIPEGKGVWTQAEPFQRKEGIFKDGQHVSGSIETSELIRFSDNLIPTKSSPAHTKLVFKSSGKIKEGLYDGTDFAGEVREFVPQTILYLGQDWKSGAVVEGKLWYFKQHGLCQGKFLDGKFIEGTFYQLAPEETNLPEQEFPDLNKCKVVSKMEGQILNGGLHGYGTLTDYTHGFRIEGTFENGVPIGPSRWMYFNGMVLETVTRNGKIKSGVVCFPEGTKFEFVQVDGQGYAPASAISLIKKVPEMNLKIVNSKEFEQMKMRTAGDQLQSAQTAAGESKNPENKSNMMAGRDWSVSEGSLTGGNYYQGGHSTSLSFGARLPLGFWPLFGFSRAMIVNTPCWQARPYSTRGLYQGCLQTVLPLRQPVLKMLFRRFK